LKKAGTFKSFKNLLNNNNEKLELSGSFQTFIFDQQSAARGPQSPETPPPLLRHWLNVMAVIGIFVATSGKVYADRGEF